jgi:hypothetical protein
MANTFGSCIKLLGMVEVPLMLLKLYYLKQDTSSEI